MINVFLGSFNIGKKGGRLLQRRKERKKPQCILTVSLALAAEGQGAGAEPLCWVAWLANPLERAQNWHGIKNQDVNSV